VVVSDCKRKSRSLLPTPELRLANGGSLRHLAGALPLSVVVGVIGVSGQDAAAIARRIEDTGEAVRVLDSLEASPDCERLVAVGESALLEMSRTGVSTPILPVAAGATVPGVPLADLEAAVARLSESSSTREWPVLGVETETTTYRALLDVLAVSSEPAKISEFSVRSRTAGADGLVDQFRADGVVLATGVGSSGYVDAVGGPQCGPGVGVAAVVPIAPFELDHRHWVLDYPVTVTVERDETDVSLQVDGRMVASVAPGQSVEITRVDTIDVLDVLERTSHFTRGSRTGVE